MKSAEADHRHMSRTEEEHMKQYVILAGPPKASRAFGPVPENALKSEMARYGRNEEPVAYELLPPRSPQLKQQRQPEPVRQQQVDLKSMPYPQFIEYCRANPL
jgi:hypothetical protein